MQARTMRASKSCSVKEEQVPWAAWRGGKENPSKGCWRDCDPHSCRKLLNSACLCIVGYGCSPWQSRERAREGKVAGCRDVTIFSLPGLDLAPATWSASAEQSLRELLGCFWRNPFPAATAKKALVSQAHYPDLAVVTNFLTHDFLVHSGTDEKRSNEELVHCLCGVASGQLSFPPKSSPGASMGPWASEPALQVIPSSSPPDACTGCACMQDQTDWGKQPAKRHYWLNELCCDYESVFLRHGNQPESENAIEYERLVSTGMTGLGGFLSPKRNMTLFSLNHMYVKHFCCILAVQIHYQASPVGGKINTLGRMEFRIPVLILGTHMQA